MAITAALGTAGASADVGPVSDAFVLSGSGTINPGVPGCSNHLIFDGNIVIAGDDTQVSTTHFDADSNICETDLFGAGSGTFGGALAGVFDYTRQGPEFVIRGTLAVNGESHTTVVGPCQFIPTSENPLTTFILTCTAVLDS